MLKFKNAGFTLIELLVAIFIFAIISVISYRTISAIIKTQQVINTTQNKWGSIAATLNQFDYNWNSVIPLAIRDQSGTLVPAVIVQPNINTNFDAQLWFTRSGSIGDAQYGVTSPKRIGFRYLNGTLYLLIWPYMNSLSDTSPQVTVLLTNIDIFTVSVLLPNQQWADTWPQTPTDFTNIPRGLQIYIKLKSGEEMTRQWAHS